MPKAIVEDKHDAGSIADYARSSLRSKKRELELALEGSFTGNQRWLLDKELRQLEWMEIQVQVLEQEILNVYRVKSIIREPLAPSQ